MAIFFEWGGSKKPQAQLFILKDRSPLRKMHAMRIACVVKGRATEQLEGELAAHDAHSAYNAVVLCVFLCRLDWHEISDLTDAIKREKACDQDIGFREIVLILPQLGRGVRCNAEE